MSRHHHQHSSKKKHQLLNTVTINLGCGGSCRRPKLSSVFTPKPRIPPPQKSTTKSPASASYHNNKYSSSSPYSSSSHHHNPPFSSSSADHYYNHSSSSSSSANNNNLPTSPLIVDGFGRQTGKKTMAVEKDSVDPYIDFRSSMLQMIVENEIYDRERLRELLNCFLQLNSQSLHGVIIRAFTEIWNSFYATSSKSSSSRRSLKGNTSSTAATATAAASEYGNNNGTSATGGDYYNWNNDYSCNTNYSYNSRNGRFRSGYYASPTVYVRPKSYEI